MDQVATLTTGWEPDTPLDDSFLRRFVFAYAERVAWMAQATRGRVDRDAAACIADAGSAFGYDTAAVLLQPPTQTALLAVLNRARQLFPPDRWWVLLSAWPLPGPPPDGMLLAGHPPLMLRPPGPFSAGQPPGLRILPADDQPSLADFDTVLNAAYPLPGGTAAADRRLLGYDLHLLVGYDQDEPVATAGARTAGGIVEAEWVSTLPSHRRHGIGAAITGAAASTDPTRSPSRERRRAQRLPAARLPGPRAPDDLGTPTSQTLRIRKATKIDDHTRHSTRHPRWAPPGGDHDRSRASRRIGGPVRRGSARS